MESNKNKISLEAFIKHWQYIVYSINGDDDFTSAEVISKHIDIITSLISKECENSTDTLNSIMEYCDKNFIFKTIFDHFNRDNLQGNIKEYGMFNQLKMYHVILKCLPNKYLNCNYLLSPLLSLLKECSLIHNSTIDFLAIKLLYQLTVLVTRDNSLFKCVKYISSRDFKEPLFFVGLIIQLIHHDKDIGRLSQEAMLLIFIYSKDQDSDLVHYICHRSNFAAMLVAGLRELYLSLPKKFDNVPDDWQQITPDFVQSVPALKTSLQLLDFCSVILKMAHPKIQVEIIDYLQTGFLSLVIGPSLHQASTEENISATAYLEVFLRHLHHPLLMKLFLEFIIKDKRDDYVILDSLLSRLDFSTMLGTFTLSLFRTILSFHCEDVMFHLIIRYLIPCSHLVIQKWNHVQMNSSTEDLSRCSLRRNPLVRIPDQKLSDTTNVFNEDLSSSAERFLKLSFGVLPINHHDEVTSCTIQGFSSISSFYSYLDSSALYVNRRILATDTWAWTYDGISPPAQIFEMLDQSSYSNTTQRFSHSNGSVLNSSLPRDLEASRTNTGRSISQYYEDQSETGKRSNEGFVCSTSPHDDSMESATLNVKALCDPSHLSREIYKLNYFQHDSEMLDNETDNVIETDLTVETDLADDDHERQDLNIDNVALTSDSDSTLPQFLVSLDLLEMRGSVQWDLDWAAITELLTEHNIHFTDRARRRLSSISDSSTYSSIDGDLFPGKAFVARNETIFERRLQSFEDSIYLNSMAAKFSITLGPFLTILFQRLREMPVNNVFVNLLVTGIITDLAAYPHPLLKNLLLDIDTILHPFLDKLYDIMLDIKERLLLQSQEIPNWESVLLHAYEYLYSRLKRPSEGSPRHVKDGDKSDIQARKSSETLLSSSKPRRFSFGLLTSLKKKEDSPKYRFPIPTVFNFKKPRFTDLECENIRNLAYSWVIFDEFCKELASLCQEHTQHCFF